MTNREEYDSTWRFHHSGPPAVDPRQPHHTPNRHWPKFDLLCDRARVQHVMVMLDVTDKLTVADEGKEQRDPRRIRLMSGGEVAGATRLLPTLAP